MNDDLAVLALALFGWGDAVRRAQGRALEVFGLGPAECSYRVVASHPSWHLRQYDGPGRRWPVLIVAAPIKRPYIWDLVPTTSVIRRLLHHGLRVHLLEWCPPSSQAAACGLDLYADRAIAACVAWITQAEGRAPFLVGHSLGGTLAAIHAALAPQHLRGLVLVGAPLCFPAIPGDTAQAEHDTPATVSNRPVLVPGCALSLLSALTWPHIFLWARMADEALGALDPRAAGLCARVERWALDEVALPGELLSQVVQLLYRENRLCRGTLRLRGRDIGPATTRVPTVAVVNAADDLVPRASIAPFLDGMATRDATLLTFAGEAGVGLQHLALLIGPRAHAEVWPEIDRWLEDHA